MLHMASRFGHADTVRDLVAQGYNVNGRDQVGFPHHRQGGPSFLEFWMVNDTAYSLIRVWALPRPPGRSPAPRPL